MKLVATVIAFAMGFFSTGLAQNTCLMGNANGVCLSTDIGTCSAVLF
ncbi:unnamed protein product [Cercospora beticola]|nr:unnamed protein product [Cercospora beticola]